MENVRIVNVYAGSENCVNITLPTFVSPREVGGGGGVGGRGGGEGEGGGATRKHLCFRWGDG